MRPDDLAAQMVRAALDKVPALDPREIDDLMMGCGQPAGEAGFNIGRAVAVELGYDFLPGTTVNRYCSSSLQTTRMAFHAIKAGEGSAFVSAGVETVSRFPKGTSDGWPDSHNPLFADAEQRSVQAAAGADEWYDPREDGVLPDVYVAMGQTAENVALLTGITWVKLVRTSGGCSLSPESLGESASEVIMARASRRSSGSGSAAVMVWVPAWIVMVR